MLNLNRNTIETVTIKEVKEIDEFLKVYNKYRDNSADFKSQVEQELGITSSEYFELIKNAKSYTANNAIPTESEWSQVRAIYREIGNQKIAQTKEEYENVCKEYTGVASVEDEVLGSISPKMAVKNLADFNNAVKATKTLRIIFSVCLGVIGFVLLTLLTEFLVENIISTNSKIIIQLIGGAGALIGTFLGALAGYKFMSFILKMFKKDLLKAEQTEQKYHKQITQLQARMQSVEAKIKKIEYQYAVEILARTDFSSLLPKPQKKKREKQEKSNKAEALNPEPIDPEQKMDETKKIADEEQKELIKSKPEEIKEENQSTNKVNKKDKIVKPIQKKIAKQKTEQN